MPAKIRTALLIDDDDVDQMIYKRIIDRSGLIEQVTSFFYAEEALDYLRIKNRPAVDVIFLDINMPRMTGLEFLEAAENEFGDSFAKIVVIMLTTSLDPRDKAKAESHASVKAYLDKPLTVENIRDVAALLADKQPCTAGPQA